MKLNVLTLDPHASRKQEVVERAQMLLSMAEAGEIVDLSYGASKADGSIVTGFTQTDDGPRRLSTVARLLHRLNLVMDEQAGNNA